MKRVLVLGGYGSFGARICELLARDRDFEVVVGGRSLEKAQIFCEARPELGLKPVRVDRDHGLAEALESLTPWLLIDAAGPFQDAGYGVARACIRAGCHYIDIADGRAFVEAFSQLDAEARAAGVILVSGASSVPALSSAVVAHLAEGLDRIGLVESAISASNRATVGRSVLEAILSYVGRTVVLRQGNQSFPARGWRSQRRMRFAASGAQPIKGRWVGVCDVPDLGLLSDRLPGAPLVVFRAGAEQAAQNLALWLLSWPVQWGWIGSLRGLAAPLQRLQGWVAWMGGDRSAMQVKVVGLRGADVVERHWTLIADQGRGPYTPCLAAPLLARRLADAELEPGARAAAGLLRLEAFAPDFAALAFVTEAVEARSGPPLYRKVMGAEFDSLPEAVRAIHEIAGAGLAEGRANVTRGANPLARLVAALMRFPPAAVDVPVQVRFFERDGQERWDRRFGASGFSSRLSRHGDWLVEQFGPLRFAFELTREPDGLAMRLRRWWLGPAPMPLAVGPRGVAREREVDGRFGFDVPISLPVVGLIVRYEGWLRRLS